MKNAITDIADYDDIQANNKLLSMAKDHNRIVHGEVQDDDRTALLKHFNKLD